MSQPTEPSRDRVGPIKFVLDRETKHKVLFREKDTNYAGAFYLRKEVWEEMGNPPGLTMAIQAVRVQQQRPSSS